MSNQLESAIVIELTDSIKWSAALPQINGTMTPVDPGLAFDVTQYARRDREFQHRDALNAVATAKVAIHAQTVWSGTVVTPRLQGVTGVFDSTGTNVQLPFDLSQSSYPSTINNTSITYVGNVSIPYDAIRITDKNLYDRDLLVYETLARAAQVFPKNTPLTQLDPTSTYIGDTSIWATADGTNLPTVPNSASALDRDLFKKPDLYLAERDNQVAAYSTRLIQALKNPFEFATRIYVAIEGIDTRESETYVLTEAVFDPTATYAAGDEIKYSDQWYVANYTTNDTPGGAAWTLLPDGPTKRQFLADPALSNRNRIIYNTTDKTLQWLREDLDTVHVPQIVGLYIPGILPNQAIHTVPNVPDRPDSQFWRQKAARISLAGGTWADLFEINPTGGPLTDGFLDTIFQSAKALTLMTPQSTTIHFDPLVVTPGSYAMTALVRPASQVSLYGNDRISGGTPDSDGGVVLNLNDVAIYDIQLPAGAWKLYLDYSNDTGAGSDSYGFGVLAALNSTAVMTDALPLRYTDENGHPLAKGTVLTSPAIELAPSGGSYALSIQWKSGQGAFRIAKLTFVCTDNETSHYVMEATWNPTNYLARLDVIGKRDVPDVMPFTFYVDTGSSNPSVLFSWKSFGVGWSSTQTYTKGDQVSYPTSSGLIYWQAATDIPAGEPPPGANANWTSIAVEPQIPLVIEQISLHKLVDTAMTPLTTGFQSFRQDMLERAIRADQDFYRQSIAAYGTNYPEFRTGGTVWDASANGTWMNFQESYNPRLREINDVASGEIVTGRYYEVVGSNTDTLTYNSTVYSNGDRFYGVEGEDSFTTSGTPMLRQVGAYGTAVPGDIGKPALVPAGLEFDQSAGTVTAWYASYASYPTIQALQPWMVEAGMYVAQRDFWSPPLL